MIPSINMSRLNLSAIDTEKGKGKKFTQEEEEGISFGIRRTIPLNGPLRYDNCFDMLVFGEKWLYINCIQIGEIIADKIYKL